MKIANWNLERVLPTQARASAIRKHFTIVNADIWILTETHELISPGTGFTSVMSGEPDRDSKPWERWAGIWSCHPIKHLRSFVSDTARCTAARIAHPDFGDIVVYATVLPWGGSKWRGIESASGAAFASALTAYANDWQRLRVTFPNALHVVAGDFNQDLAPYHYYGSKRQHDLLESELVTAGMIALTADANDPIDWDSSKRHACIDHICVSKSHELRIGNIIRWPEAASPDPHLSDHFGVAVEISHS
jgi:endonuclease/exonuclease/phosphatase family metal-dependent hydrolase